MHFIDDDTFAPDDNMPEEWLAQVFEVASLKSGNKQNSRSNPKFHSGRSRGNRQRS
jgi:hypothetical protein